MTVTNAEGGVPQQLAERLLPAVQQLGELVMQFALMDRQAWLTEEGARESNTDHTVMVGIIAGVLVDYVPGLHSHRGLVAELSLIHDFPEVYAGDTSTIMITQEGLSAKDERELAAENRIDEEFGSVFPRLPWLISLYREGSHPAVQHVKIVDKFVRSITHVRTHCAALRAAGITTPEAIDASVAITTSRLAEFAEDNYLTMTLRSSYVSLLKKMIVATD